MDTPLHALAVPDADRSGLRQPEDAAQELLDAIANAMAIREIGDERVASAARP